MEHTRHINGDLSLNIDDDILTVGLDSSSCFTTVATLFMCLSSLSKVLEVSSEAASLGELPFEESEFPNVSLSHWEKMRHIGAFQNSTLLKKIHAKKCTIFKFLRQKMHNLNILQQNFLDFKSFCAKIS